MLPLLGGLTLGLAGPVGSVCLNRYDPEPRFVLQSFTIALHPC